LGIKQTIFFPLPLSYSPVLSFDFLLTRQISSVNYLLFFPAFVRRIASAVKQKHQLSLLNDRSGADGRGWRLSFRKGALP